MAWQSRSAGSRSQVLEEQRHLVPPHSDVAPLFLLQRVRERRRYPGEEVTLFRVRRSAAQQQPPVRPASQQPLEAEWASPRPAAEPQDLVEQAQPSAGRARAVSLLWVGMAWLWEQAAKRVAQPRALVAVEVPQPLPPLRPARGNTSAPFRRWRHQSSWSATSSR